MYIIQPQINPKNIALYMLSMLIALTIREAAHAKAAKTLGDPTAFLLKRTSLNPIVHIDPLGSFLIPFFHNIKLRNTYWLG